MLVTKMRDPCRVTLTSSVRCKDGTVFPVGAEVGLSVRRDDLWARVCLDDKIVVDSSSVCSFLAQHTYARSLLWPLCGGFAECIVEWLLRRGEKAAQQMTREQVAHALLETSADVTSRHRALYRYQIDRLKVASNICLERTPLLMAHSVAFAHDYHEIQLSIAEIALR
jgi:hypothetical protein